MLYTYELLAVVFVLFLFASSLLSSYKIHNNILSPIVVHSTFWLLPSLITLIPHTFPMRLKPITWVVIFMSYIFYLIGYLMIVLIIPRQQVKATQTIRSWEKSYFKHSLYTVFIIGMMGFIINISNLVTTSGVNIYLSEGFRTAETVFGGVSPIVNYMYFLNMLVFPVSILYMKIYERDPSVVFITIISAITFLFHGTKSTIILPTLIASYIYLTTNFDFNLKVPLFTLIVSVTSFAFVNTIGRYSAHTNSVSTLPYIARKTIDVFVLYIGPNYANLQENVLLRDNFTGGKGVLNPFLRLLTFERYSFSISGEYLVNDAYNMSTYLNIFYTDFYIIGIVVCPLLVGCISTIIYYWYLNSPSVTSVTVYSFILSMNTMAFWGNHFLRIQYWWLLTVIVIVNIRSKKSKAIDLEREGMDKIQFKY